MQGTKPAVCINPQHPTAPRPTASHSRISAAPNSTLQQTHCNALPAPRNTLLHPTPRPLQHPIAPYTQPPAMPHNPLAPCTALGTPQPAHCPPGDAWVPPDISPSSTPFPGASLPELGWRHRTGCPVPREWARRGGRQRAPVSPLQGSRRWLPSRDKRVRVSASPEQSRADVLLIEPNAH